MSEPKKSATGCTIVFILAIAAAMWFGGNALFAAPSVPVDLADDEMTNSMKIEVLSCAQTALSAYLDKPDFSRSVDDYHFIRWGNQYQIHGTVDGTSFSAEIQWDYKKGYEGVLTALQVGPYKLIG